MTTTTTIAPTFVNKCIKFFISIHFINIFFSLFIPVGDFCRSSTWIENQSLLFNARVCALRAHHSLMFPFHIVCVPILKLVLCVISHGAIASHSLLCVRIQFITLHFICHNFCVCDIQWFLLLLLLQLFGIFVSLSFCFFFFNFILSVKSHFYLETNLQTHLKAAQYVIEAFQD